MDDPLTATDVLPWVRQVREPPPPALTRLAKDVLRRCRGEGPANCVARCPLGVDARGYVQLARQRRYREALQLVREKLPFPGVLGYVCTHPCEQHCKRLDEDAPVRVRDIKRFLAEWEPGEPQHVLACEPGRPERVAVVGAGPAGLIAAHDLRRRGFQVTVFEREQVLGGCLARHVPGWRLPRRVLARDLSIVAALGIEVRFGVDVGRDVSVEDLRQAFDSVLLLVGFAGAFSTLERDPGLHPNVRTTIGVNPATGETFLPEVFAAGDAVTGPSTVIDALAQGRRAAESTARFLAGQDQLEGRDTPLPRPLLWKLETDDVERRRRVRTPAMLEPFTPGLDEAGARAEAERCLDCQCGLCVKDCEFLSKHSRSPKDLARLVLAGLEPAATRSVVYSCNVCQLCATVCPERLDTGQMMLEARREAVRANLGPLPQHEPVVAHYETGASKAFTLAMPEPGRTRSRRLFFTGCSLPAVAPAHTIRVYDELRRAYPGTGVLMWCCGAPADLLGMEEAFERTRRQILDAAEGLGAEELVAACPDCTHVLKAAMPELRVTTVWERLAGSWELPASRAGVRVSIHDSCKTRHEDGLHDAVRQLLRGVGATVQDVEYRGQLARCCGLGGMVGRVDPDLVKRVAQRRGAESPLPMVTYCPGCRQALATNGKESVHILDFMLPGDWRQAAARKPPGALPRYFNRLRVKWAFSRMRPLGAGGK